MKTVTIGSLIVPALTQHETPLRVEAAIIDKYKKGYRVIVNVDTAKSPEYYVATVTKKSPKENLVYILFDDGEKWQYKATSSAVGILGLATQTKKRVKPIKAANLKKWLVGHPDAPDATKTTGKGTIKRQRKAPAKPSAAPQVPVKPSGGFAVTPDTDIEKHGDKPSVNKKKPKVIKEKKGVAPMPTSPNPAVVKEYSKAYRKHYARQLEIHIISKYTPKADTSKLERKNSELQKELFQLERKSGDPAGCAKERKRIIVYEAPKIVEVLEDKYADDIAKYVPSWA